MLKESRFDHRPTVAKKKKANPLPQNPDEASPERAVGLGRFPSWLHRKLPKGGNLWKTDQVIDENRLHTVCEECKCPNLLECWSKKTATFLAMGKECTRACGFCDIAFSKTPPPLEADEPFRIAESARKLGLQHVVVTMVTRDDLEDGGASHIAKIIRQLRADVKGVTIEVLTSDFAGNREAWDLILEARPDIFNYNIETVREFTPKVRHKATYERTLELLSYIRDHGQGMLSKSGIMVGFGETEEQVKETIRDLKGVDCDIITIGQYLQANRHKLKVKEFVPPEQFKKYEDFGHSIGVKHMYCGPFVRSSYNAGQVLEQLKS